MKTHVTPRWILGAGRLHGSKRLRDLQSVVRRRVGMGPRSASVVPRPARIGPGERPLQLTHVLVASDRNARYLDVWPLARHAWREIAGLEPILVLVADEADVPQQLRADPLVRIFTPVLGVHTAFQAQCIRLLYPALLDGAGGVLLADIDMAPMNRRYFHAPVSRVRQTDLVAYRDILLPDDEVPICYNAALPSTWRELFGVASEEDVAARLAAWADGIAYDGAPGGAGWATDQRALYRGLVDFGTRTGRVWILDDHYTGFRRLQAYAIATQGLTHSDERLIQEGRYSDFHCALPYGEFRVLNERAVELGIKAARQF